MAANKTLERTMFETPRVLEFFDAGELVKQTSYQQPFWPLIVLKELVDNALDACESVNVSPDISVNIECQSGTARVTVTDNGPGITSETVARLLNFSTKLSDKSAYRSPTRGQQGNAWKTILAIPFVMSTTKPQAGKVTIESRGIRHIIETTVDLVEQKPAFTHDAEPVVKSSGCEVSVWMDLTSGVADPEPADFLQILQGYTLFNPHASLRCRIVWSEWNEDRTDTVKASYTGEWIATDSSLVKWRPNEPTSAYWYDAEDARRLVFAYISNARNGGRDLTLREFTSEFRGLSGSGKQKAITSQFSQIKRLSDIAGNGSVSEPTLVNRLFDAMRDETRPVPSSALGRIGEGHFRKRFGTLTKYACRVGKGRVPFVVEAAFAPEDEGQTNFYFGANSSVSVFRDPFRQVDFWLSNRGIHGHGIQGLANSLSLHSQTGGWLACHITHPCLRFLDRGKTEMHITDGELRQAIAECIYAVLKEHHAEKEREDKQHIAVSKKAEKEANQAQKASRGATLKDAVFAVLMDCHKQATSDFTLRAQQRQTFYVVRRAIQRYTTRELKIDYFRELCTLYEEQVLGGEAIPNMTYDDRGNFYEPHGGKQVPLGTEAVENYTIPSHHYGAILFVEKEGFLDIINDAHIPSRWDIAVMTSKGLAVRAAKALLYAASQWGIPILVAHDCDLDGYKIARAIENETRRSRGMVINIIDIGLKLTEAQEMGLELERVTRKRGPDRELWASLTDDERAFFITKKPKDYYGSRGTYEGNRVELNAMTSPQFVAWVEDHLERHGIKKVMPPANELKAALTSKTSVDLDTRINQMVQGAIEELLGNSMSGLADEVHDLIGEPAITADLVELQNYLAGNELSHWTVYSESKATHIAWDFVKDKQEAITLFLAQRVRENLK